jgi:HAD superfamily hydrolase (TIGR01509 family)
VAAVLFDMDGVQVDSESLHAIAFERLLEEFGAVAPPDADQAFRGLDDRAIFAAVRESLGLPLDLDELIARRTRHFLDVLAESDLEPMDGLLPLFDDLDRHGIPFALGSSSVIEIVEAVLAKLGTRHRFGAIVTSSDVARGKPAPDIYLEAAARLGVAPHRCVVIEDARSGIEAARAAGARTVLLLDPRYAEAREIEADWIVENLREIDAGKIRELTAKS